MSQVYKFHLPFPPSVNSIWRRGAGKTYLSARAVAYRKAAAESMKVQGLIGEAIAVPVRVIIAVQLPDKRKRDLDNLAKLPFDSLTACGFWKDDDLIDDFRIVKADLLDRDYDRYTKKGRLILIVTPV